MTATITNHRHYSGLSLRLVLSALCCFVLTGASGCKWLKNVVGVSQETLGSDGGVPDLASPITFSVSPSSQTVTMTPTDGGLYDHDFCMTSSVAFTGTLTNNSSSPIYVSALASINVNVTYFRYNGTNTTPLSGILGLPKIHPTAATAVATQLLEPGAHVDFPILGVCKSSASDPSLQRYPYNGTGTYTASFTYQYTGPDAPVNFQDRDAGPNFDAGENAPTFRDAITASEVTINAM